MDSMEGTAAAVRGEAFARTLPRPREKLRQRGAGALSDAELIALLLGSGTRRHSAARIARHVARRAPHHLGGWTLRRWLEIPGIGLARAAALVAAFELGRRACERPAASRPIRGPDDVLAQVRDLPRARREHFIVLLLNARHELQCRETVSIACHRGSQIGCHIGSMSHEQDTSIPFSPIFAARCVSATAASMSP